MPGLRSAGEQPIALGVTSSGALALTCRDLRGLKRDNPTAFPYGYGFTQLPVALQRSGNCLLHARKDEFPRLSLLFCHDCSHSFFQTASA
jgi:hypothetical protein